MGNAIAKWRDRRYREQGDCCIWCGTRTFPAGSKATPALAHAFDIEPFSSCWRRRLRQYEASAEHILPRSQGGFKGAGDNIVVACRHCNTKRGEDPAALKPNALVAARLPLPVQYALNTICEVEYTH